MKRVLTIALLVGAMLAGCSKEDSENMEEQTLTKEQIVGVWRNGDYWVSFSEDGYNSAYLPYFDFESIDEGDFSIDGDTITVENSYFFNRTKYVVQKSESNNLVLELIYPHPHIGGDQSIFRKIISFQKTDLTPCKKEDGLKGVTFNCNVLSKINKKQTTFQVKIENSPYHNLGWKSAETSGNGYYIYLNPVIYFVLFEGLGMYDLEVALHQGELDFDEYGKQRYLHIK